MYKGLAILNVELELRICNRSYSPDVHQKVVEIHRLSINRLSIAKTSTRAWMVFRSVPHLRRSVY